MPIMADDSDLYDGHPTGLPLGCWPGRRKEMISAPSLATIMLERRLPETPSGTPCAAMRRINRR